MRRCRTLDVGTTKCYLQAPAPRVACAEHRVVVADVPWARPGSKHTYVFGSFMPEDRGWWYPENPAFRALIRLSAAIERLDGVDPGVPFHPASWKLCPGSTSLTWTWP